MSTFPSQLKKLREELNMEQFELANELNIRTSTVSKYEQGISQPNIDTLIKIADIFDVTTDYLLGLSDSDDPITRYSDAALALLDLFSQLPEKHQYEVKGYVSGIFSLISKQDY